MEPFPRCEKGIFLLQALALLVWICLQLVIIKPAASLHLSTFSVKYLWLYCNKNLMLQWKISDGHRLIKITTCDETFNNGRISFCRQALSEM